jgi:hypothetical protein
MILMGYSGAQGTLIYEKNLKSKILCQTPFKPYYTGNAGNLSMLYCTPGGRASLYFFPLPF